ncbi:hypothetical protein FHX81_7778 [Saccharothrix saharensis]|uniref:Uncharacterized protein n=1 Tax=Saccharothrix saharensis TaxID=571190 RepID=A0A543JR32_9PSEU|nr:hypothetical protein [Saccharothrix saharensis]TQM85299.1 hypothetical protein FHX81_7778 [Saccharothrix saharensis]
MTTREELLNPLNEAFDKVKRAVEEMTTKFDEVTDKLSSPEVALVLGPVPLYLTRNDVEDLGELVQKVIDLADYAVQHHLPVVSLINQSFNWLENVKAPMSEMSSRTSVWRDQDFEYWREAAGFAYRTKATAQQGAIDDIAAKAEFISKWLFEIAQANVNYMVELAGIAAEVAGKVAQLAVKAGTIVLLPLAAADAADIVGNLVDKGLKNLVKEADRFMATLGKIREVESQLADYTKFPGGKWPEAVAG